jgi:hypothetical protein
MKKIMVLPVLFIGIFLLILASCSSDKNSPEACRYETSVNLDKGNYDAVLASSCADVMQIGAAWFGKAGFDITNVINGFIDADDSTQAKSDLNIYMTSLVGDVTGNTLDNLDNARGAYNSVTSTESGYKDAQFYISLVDSVKSLSLIKNVVGDNIVGPDGALNSTCDNNDNDVPDSADAVACQLIAVTNINSAVTTTLCSNVPHASYLPSMPVPITTLTNVATSQTITGTYSGLTVTLASFGSGTTSGCDPAGNTVYKQLLYRDENNNWWAATTTSEVCSDGTNTWPCPMTGSNLDLVGAINASLSSAVNSLDTALTGTSDVQQAITDLQNQACTTPCLTAGCPGPSCPSTCTSPYDMSYCTSQNLADYITTNLK